MIIQKIWYQSIKLFLKVSLHFFAKKIKISGRENIPKKGAILFAINHPNALMDPLFATVFNPRINHYLVRADVFKNPLIRKLLNSLNLMPIYRIRDGRNQLSNNEMIFKKCFNILKRKETLIIFPQGGHCRDRTIQPLSKGFTRIVFGALEENPGLEIAVIPVGITFQNSSKFPSKVAVKFGEVINSREILASNEKPKAINILKNEVSNQLKKLSVHIPNDENFANTLSKLNAANIDFTEVDTVNKIIETQNFPEERNKNTNYLKPVFFLIVINSFIPYLIWKKLSKTIVQIEFIDTMKFGLNIILIPLFYFLQAYLVTYFFNFNIGLIYFLTSLALILFYVKLAPTNTED